MFFCPVILRMKENQMFLFYKDKAGVISSFKTFPVKNDTTISEYLFSAEGHCLNKQLEGGEMLNCVYTQAHTEKSAEVMNV